MDEKEARFILRDSTITSDNGLYNLGLYLFWSPGNPELATLDGGFSVEELEAIVWWMKNKSGGEDR